MRDLEICVAVDRVHADAFFTLQLHQPLWNLSRSVVVVGEEKAREHSRIGASLSEIVGDRPEHDEQQARITRHAPHGFGLRKLRLDRPNARH